MARPKKKGIDYFPLDVGFFSNPKIKYLKARYGADGITIYIYLLCEIYKKGYYLKASEEFLYVLADDLRMSINKVKQVLAFLLERSMFDKQLFQSDTVLTSTGIQERFQLAVKERAKKNPIIIERFWLLKKEETEPFIKVTFFEEEPQNNKYYSGKNSNNSEEKSLKESKVNNNIYFNNPELDAVFRDYIKMREKKKDRLTTEQIQILKEDLLRMSKTDEERIVIVRKALSSGWMSFYPVKNKDTNMQRSQAKTQKKNAFHNFEQREYDYEAIEKALDENFGKEYREYERI